MGQGDHLGLVGRVDPWCLCRLLIQLRRLCRCLQVGQQDQGVRYLQRRQARQVWVAQAELVGLDHQVFLVGLRVQAVLEVRVVQMDQVVSRCQVAQVCLLRQALRAIQVVQEDPGVQVGKVCMEEVLEYRKVPLEVCQVCQVFLALLVFLAFQACLTVQPDQAGLASSNRRN